MATKYYYFKADPFDLPEVEARVPALAVLTQLSSSPLGTSFLVISGDDTYETDILEAMADQGFTLLSSSLTVPPAFAQVRTYGALAADPAAGTFGAPAAGDNYWNTTTAVWRVYNGTAWVGITGADTSVLSWGSDSVGTTVATRFLSPWYSDTLAQVSPVQWRSPRNALARNLRVRHNTTAGNGNAIVYTLRVNGVASALTVSLASTVADGSDLVNSVVIAAGDLLDLEVTKAAGIGASPSEIMAVFELV
jgi:hypothetical protein